MEIETHDLDSLLDKDSLSTLFKKVDKDKLKLSEDESILMKRLEASWNAKNSDEFSQTIKTVAQAIEKKYDPYVIVYTFLRANIKNLADRTNQETITTDIEMFNFFKNNTSIDLNDQKKQYHFLWMLYVNFIKQVDKAKRSNYTLASEAPYTISFVKKDDIPAKNTVLVNKNIILFTEKGPNRSRLLPSSIDRWVKSEDSILEDEKPWKREKLFFLDINEIRLFLLRLVYPGLFGTHEKHTQKILDETNYTGIDSYLVLIDKYTELVSQLKHDPAALHISFYILHMFLVRLEDSVPFGASRSSLIVNDEDSIKAIGSFNKLLKIMPIQGLARFLSKRIGGKYQVTSNDTVIPLHELEFKFQQRLHDNISYGSIVEIAEGFTYDLQVFMKSKEWTGKIKKSLVEIFKQNEESLITKVRTLLSKKAVSKTNNDLISLNACLDQLKLFYTDDDFINFVNKLLPLLMAHYDTANLNTFLNKIMSNTLYVYDSAANALVYQPAEDTHVFNSKANSENRAEISRSDSDSTNNKKQSISTENKLKKIPISQGPSKWTWFTQTRFYLFFASIGNWLASWFV